jgi:MGT family glycosyltransferase
MDNKEGHILPSLGIAHALKKDGHEIIYISIIDNETLIKEQGFLFFPVLEDLYPRGYNQGTQKPKKIHGNSSFDDRYLIFKLIDGELEPFLKMYRPDLFIATSFLVLECLVLHYKYKIRPVILTTYLRNPENSLVNSCIKMLMDMPGEIVTTMIDFVHALGIRLTSLKDFVMPLSEFYELIVCPRELEMDQRRISEKLHYIGPSIRPEPSQKDRSDSFPERLAATKKIIYASLGSYTALYGESLCIDFYRKMVNVMRHPDLSDTFLVLAAGRDLDINKIGPMPENVHTAGWIPQLEILKRASLVVCQGGLGTIKESIYYGVPMIVFPLVNDQPRNATLVEHHRLGVRGKLEDMTEEKLRTSILYVLNDPSIRDNIQKMRSVFREREAAGEGVRIINGLL